MTVKIQGKQAHGSVYPLSSLFDTVDLLSYRYPSDAANFCVCLLKPLERSYGYALRSFYKHSSKIRYAQNPWKQ